MHHQPKLRNTSYIILSTIISILISYKDMNFKPASLVPVSQFRSFRGRGEVQALRNTAVPIHYVIWPKSGCGGWMGVQRACRRDPTKADKMAKEALSEDSPSLHSI